MSIIDDLLKQHRKNYFDIIESDLHNYQNLSQGQSPKVLIIACSDSRVDPAILMNRKLGDIFVVRHVANLVPEYQNQDHKDSIFAAIEFAVVNLKVEHVIVLGHSFCGGIEALLEQDFDNAHESLVLQWLALFKDFKKTVPQDFSKEEQLRFLEKKMLKVSLQNLENMPFIQEKLSLNKLSLHAWYFELEDFHLFGFNKEKDEFENLTLEDMLF